MKFQMLLNREEKYDALNKFCCAQNGLKYSNRCHTLERSVSSTDQTMGFINRIYFISFLIISIYFFTVYCDPDILLSYLLSTLQVVNLCQSFY